ncbi:MAG: hypothetical protein P1U56_09995 [Saprospiraceae bacterium]|nr:hypothetical protein [Saprospiraceae bacterium]
MKSKQAFYRLLFLFMLFSSEFYGQQFFTLDFGTRNGYEHNVFNGNESRRLIQDGDTISSIQSGYFYSLSAMVNWKIKSERQELQLMGKWGKDYFPRLNEADLIRPQARIKYVLKMHKRHTVYASAQHSQYLTNRPEDDTEVLRPPRAYKKNTVDLKYSLKPFQGNRMSFETGYVQKLYQTDDTREFHYHGMNYEFSMSQRIKKSKRWSHYFKVDATYSIRNYEDITFVNDSEEDIERFRDWRYSSLTGTYEVKYRKQFKWVLGARVLDRRDVLQNRFSYFQYQPFSRILIKSKNVEYSMKASVVHRVYDTLKAQTNLTTPLKHIYFRMSASLNVQFNERIRMLSRISWVKRTRNLEEGARSFLGYENLLASIGLNFRLF